MKQKLAALFVTVALALCALPMAAFADGATKVNDETELLKAAQDSSCTVIELTANITLTKPVSFGRNVTLKSAEGGRFTLAADGSFSENENLVTFTAGGTVNSLNLDAGGKAKYAIHAYNCAVTVEDSGVSGGRYRGLLVNGKNASADISNCTFENNTWAAIEVASSSSAGVPEPGCVTLGQGITSDKALVQVDINKSQDHYAGAYVQFKDGASYSFPIVGEKSLQDAVNAVTSGGSVTLGADITLTSAIEVPAGKTITVNGDGHDITLSSTWSGPSYTAFNETSSGAPEGLRTGTTLVVNSVDFFGHTTKQEDHAVVVSSNGSVNVSLNGCSFNNMHDAVYCNFVSDSNAVKNNIAISGCTFTNVAYAYGVDDGVSTGARVDKHNFTLSGNTNEPPAETFAVAAVDGVGYDTLDEALTAAAASNSKTLTLRKDVALDKMLTLNTEGLIFDLGGKTISASANFPKDSDNNKNHLVDITADNVILKNGTLKAGRNNNHTLNVWNAQGVELAGLTLDNAASYGGAPLIVGASAVTVKDGLNVVTGANSWYGINVDSRNVGSASTPNKKGASITVAPNVSLVFEGQKPTGIYMENNVEMNGNDVKLGFGSGVTFNSSIPSFVPVVVATGDSATVTDPGNAGLQDNGDGTFGKKPTPTPKPEEPWTPGPTATPAPAQVLDSTPKTGAVSLAVLPLAGLAFAGLGFVTRKREE